MSTDDTTTPEATETADDALNGPVPQPTPNDTSDGGPVPQDDAQGQDDGDGDEPKGRGARYRLRAQEAETARDEAVSRADQLAGQVEQLQRLHVEAAAAKAGIKPAALFAVAELGDLLGDDGLPDDKKVVAAAAAAREQLGVARPDLAKFRAGGNLRSGAGVGSPRRDGWSSAFARQDGD